MSLSGSKPFSVILSNFKTKWTPGYTSAKFFGVKQKNFYMLLKENTGDVRIHKVTGDGLVTGKVWDASWTNGWTTLDFFDTSSGTFLYIMKKSGRGSDGHNVHIHEMNDDGSVGDRVDQRKWSSGWTTAEFYERAGDPFLLLLKKNGSGADDNNIHLHKMDSDGTVGDQIQSHSTREGWTSAKIFSVGSDSFLFLMSDSDGEVAVYKVNTDGTIDFENIISSYNWTSGWDTTEFFEEAGKTYLFLLKSSGFSGSSRNVHIHEMNADGSVGSRVIDYAWTQGWTNVSIRNFGGYNHLALLKSETGQGHHHQMNSDGTVGLRVDPDEPNNLRFYRKLWTTAGNGMNFLNDYWREISNNKINLNGTVVTGWHTIPKSWEEVKELSRHQKIQAGVDAAKLNGYHPPSDHYIAVIHSSQPDSGAAGNRILGHPNRDNVTFYAHEMGHLFGLGHSYSDDENYKSASWSDPGEYDDSYDIMSAMSVKPFTPPGGVRSGPGMNAFNLKKCGWLNPADTCLLNENIRYRAVVIRALSDKRSQYRPPYILRIPIAKNFPVSGDITDAYSVELRTPRNWDAGIGDALPLIHKHTSNRSYLLRTPRNHLRRREPVSHVYDSENDIAITALYINQNQGEGVFYTANSNNNVQVHRIGQDGVPDGEVYRNKWSGGWTTADFYQAGQRTFLFLMKDKGAGADGKNVHIHRMNQIGTVGIRTDSRSWTSGWTTARFYQDSDKTYLFLLKKEGAGADDNNIHIHEMTPDGTVGDRIQSESTLEGWTSARFYSTNGKQYLFLLSESTGTVHIYQTGQNGEIDFSQAIETRNWTSGWDTAEFFQTGGKIFLFILKSSGFTSRGKNVHIYEMNTDGTIGAKVADARWTGGWTNARFHRIQNKVYLQILKEEGAGGSGHNLHTYVMHQDGTIGNRIADHKLKEGWKTMNSTTSAAVTGGEGLFLVIK